MGKALEGFQTQVARRLTGQIPQRTTDGKWIYTLAAAAREEAGFLTMEGYVRRFQNTVAQYIATRSLLDLWGGAERAPGALFGMWLCEHKVIDLARAQEAAAAVAEEEGVEK